MAVAINQGFAGYRAGLKEDEAGFISGFPVRCSQRCFEQPERVGLHYHHCLELVAFEGAAGEVRVAGQRMALKGDDVLAIPPGMLHAYELAAGGAVAVVQIDCRSLRAAFSDDLCQMIGWEDFAWLERIAVTVADPDTVRRQMAVVAAACEDRSAAVPGVLRCAVPCAELFAALRRGLSSELLAADAGDADERIRRVVEFSEAQWSRPIRLAEAAEVACLSVPQFCRVFKKSAGVGYIEYLSRLRVGQACRMLDSGMPATMVCHEAGFGNLSYFIQVFRRQTGVTPGRWRKPPVHFSQSAMP